MRINIKDSFREVSGKIAKYIELSDTVPTPINGGDMTIDVVFGDVNSIYADRVNVVLTQDDLKDWGPDEVLINLILTKLAVEKTVEIVVEPEITKTEEKEG